MTQDDGEVCKKLPISHFLTRNLVGLTICQIQSEYGKSKEIIHHESGQANQTHQLLESKYS